MLKCFKFLEKQFFFMNKGITVQTILIVVLAVIFVIAAAAILNVMFPYIGVEGGCTAAQKLHIEEIDSMYQDAKNKGITYIVKFRVEGDCVECLWYDVNLNQIRIRWSDMSTTEPAVGVDVSSVWSNIGNNAPVVDDLSCDPDDDANLRGGNSYILEITPQGVNHI